jgi:hypothetical protein
LRAAFVYEDPLVLQLAIMRGPEGDWRAESVGYERWSGDRVETTAGADASVRGVEREDYIYDSRGRIDRIVQSRNWTELGYSDAYAIASRQTWTAVRDEVGALEAVLDGTSVAWRRRRPGQGKLLAAAEDALLRDLIPVVEGHAAVEIRHQDDGPWSDQLEAELSAGPAGSLSWSRSPATEAAILALNELGEPKPGAARRLLVTVAKRLGARPGAPTITVIGFSR